MSVYHLFPSEPWTNKLLLKSVVVMENRPNSKDKSKCFVLRNLWFDIEAPIESAVAGSHIMLLASSRANGCRIFDEVLVTKNSETRGGGNEDFCFTSPRIH